MFDKVSLRFLRSNRFLGSVDVRESRKRKPFFPFECNSNAVYLLPLIKLFDLKVKLLAFIAREKYMIMWLINIPSLLISLITSPSDYFCLLCLFILFSFHYWSYGWMLSICSLDNFSFFPSLSTWQDSGLFSHYLKQSSTDEETCL